MKLAEFVCVACSHHWKEPPGQVSCQRCGSIYCRWVNYESDFSNEKVNPKPEDAKC